MQLSTAPPSALLLLLAHHAHAHVKLVQPVPYGAASLNTEPLESTGADWPCKQRPGAYDITSWNVMPINSQQTISFQGQATHGGGSCQISLTRDTPPTVNSVFKVIKSIEGGCPSTNPGNVGTDPMGYGADKFTFAIPDAISPANYTLAWTWFNKIGNREMYMNCAPVTVTPASKKRHLSGRRRGTIEQRTDSMGSLPDVFRANSGNGCSSPPSGNVVAIPAANLGTNIQKIGSDPLVPPVGSCGGSSADVAKMGVALSASPAPSTPPSPVTSSLAPPVSSVTPASYAPPAPVSPATSESPAGPPSAPATTTGTCPTPGKSVCSPDGNAWGTCMENLQVIYQPVAAGTKCDAALGVEVSA